MDEAVGSSMVLIVSTAVEDEAWQNFNPRTFQVVSLMSH